MIIIISFHTIFFFSFLSSKFRLLLEGCLVLCYTVYYCSIKRIKITFVIRTIENLPLNIIIIDFALFKWEMGRLLRSKGPLS